MPLPTPLTPPPSLRGPRMRHVDLPPRIQRRSPTKAQPTSRPYANVPITPARDFSGNSKEGYVPFTNARLEPIPGASPRFSPFIIPIRSIQPQPTSNHIPIPNSEFQAPVQASEKLVHDRIQEQETLYKNKVANSAERTWCTPVSRDTQLHTIQGFYNKMHNDDTLDTAHCRVCYQQRAPVQLVEYTWAEFEPLYTSVIQHIPELDRGHFSCAQCFPRQPAAYFLVCKDCEKAMTGSRPLLPFACRANNLALGCTHRYPNALKDLSPLEERLIGIYTPCGWITKLEIAISQPTSGKYRRHKKGHITVFPNDVESVACEVLPHPLVEELDRIHVCFVGPKQPLPQDLGFMLSVNPQRLKRALVWLKANNKLYERIHISQDHLDSWSVSHPGTEVPQAIIDRWDQYEHLAEDDIRTGQYVPAAERGLPDEPVQGPEEALAMLADIDKEAEAARLEDESNGKLGGIRMRDQALNELEPRIIDSEVEELVSTGLMTLEAEAEHNPIARLKLLLEADLAAGRHYRGRKAGEGPGIHVGENDRRQYIISRRGENFADSNDPDFFPKTFPCLFPWGRGGPKVLESDTEIDQEQATEGKESTSSKSHNFYLRPWARLLLERHGAHFATHPTFPFLVFNMLVRSENRRISYLRVNKKSFSKVEEIVASLTAEELDEAAEEYRETRTTTNPKISYLLTEISAFGYHQHMSNEERLYSRRKIQSLCLKRGMPSIWYTINPNDLTNEVNMKLAAFRVADGSEAEKLMEKFRQHIGSVQHVVRDPVSSAKFFHRSMETFFEECVRVGRESIFGRVSCYFGCVETNERGALHIHGLLWLEDNLELPTLFQDLGRPENSEYTAQVCAYIDSVFHECCDEKRAKTYGGRYKSVYKDISHLTTDLEKLDAAFDDEANWVAYRCQMHSCGPTCTKYSFKQDRNGKLKSRHPCRFKAPWILRMCTEFTSNGLFQIRRDHERINRHNKAITVAMRHNTDVTFLPTNSTGLSMVYYATNYSTKLETPLWKRAALMKVVLVGLGEQEADAGQVGEEETDARSKVVHNKTRQFLARVANQIFTSRELSAVEVCANLLGYKNSYSSEQNWVTLHVNTLYWAVFRRWVGIQDAASDEGVELRPPPETTGIGNGGITLHALEAYAHRGPLLEKLCYYEYLSMVSIRKVGKRTNLEKPQFIRFDETLPDRQYWVQELLETSKQAVPVITGYLDSDVHGTQDGFYQRSAVLLLALFVPWQKFLPIATLPPVTLWSMLSTGIPGHVRGIFENVRLLHKSAEDAKKDAQLWANRAEGDEGVEFDGPEEDLAPGTTWNPSSIDLRFTFNEAVQNLHDGVAVTKDAPALGKLVHALDQASFSQPEGTDEQGCSVPATERTGYTLTKRNQRMANAALKRLHEARLMAIEGDDEIPVSGAEVGFGDDGEDSVFPATQPRSPEQPRVWVGLADGDSFMRAGQIIGGHRTLNRMQKVALGLICEAMDNQANGSTHQLLLYIGGGGGTGKSWLIDTLQQVFTAQRVSNQLVITATSGTAAAGIGGNTVHSSLGIVRGDNNKLKDLSESVPGKLEQSKQLWRRRKALVIDEVSMLGCATFHDVDQRIRQLRGFMDKPFGGLPIVILTGDFLQFGPVQEKSLLDNRKANRMQVKDKDWEQAQGRDLWKMFTEVVMLEEQKRAQGDTYLLGFLQRLRTGRQTTEDAKRLEARYDADARFDLANGRRAIIPLNQHRWDLTLDAVLAYGAETGRKVSVFLSKHEWSSRKPTMDEMVAAMLYGNNSVISMPGIFPYVDGMPVIVNENKYIGLKVVNGGEFTAVGIIPPSGLEEYSINDKLSIFFGPPEGIILRSEATENLAIPHLPPNTILLGAKSFTLPASERAKITPRTITICRTGLPCVPGLAMTDYKAQGRTLPSVTVSLIGRRMPKVGQAPSKCDAVSMYVQLSRVRRFEDIRLFQPLNVKHFLEARMPDYLVNGVKALQDIAKRTVAGFEERYGYQG